MEMLGAFVGTFGATNTIMLVYVGVAIVSCGFMYTAYQVLKKRS
jgi:hypothetical protein